MHANFMWSSQQAVIINLYKISPLVFSIAEGLCSLWVRIWIFINYWISFPSQGVKMRVRNHVPVSKWLFIQHTPVSSETWLHSRCTLSRWFVTYKDVRRCKDCRVWTGTFVRPQLCRDLGGKIDSETFNTHLLAKGNNCWYTNTTSKNKSKLSLCLQGHNMYMYREV
jgi:hypothetical protein